RLRHTASSVVPAGRGAGRYDEPALVVDVGTVGTARQRDVGAGTRVPRAGTTQLTAEVGAAHDVLGPFEVRGDGEQPERQVVREERDVHERAQREHPQDDASPLRYSELLNTALHDGVAAVVSEV